MRRSIKILAGIVVLFLLLVIVSAAMSGNNSNTSTPTPTAATAQATKSVAKATATPSAAAATNNATFDPTLKKLETALKAEYPGVIITEYPANANRSTDYLGVFYTLPNGNTLSGTADNDTISYQTARYQTLEKPITDETLDQANATAFGQSAVASVLGGSITTQDTNLQTPGTPYFSDEYILYTGSASQNAIFFEFVQGGT
jgi:hypothetical protein